MSLDIQYLIRHRKRGSYQKHQKNSYDFILKLLKRNPATLETIANYIKKDKRTTRQFITLLRRQGYYITLKGYGGYYELRKITCHKCGFGSLTVNGARKHYTRSHVVKKDLILK